MSTSVSRLKSAILRASGGAEATPAGREPGKPTLKPGPDLVGKVWEIWNPSME